MAVVRRGGCVFFLRSLRRGGRVTSEYLGSGSIGVDEAARVGERRQVLAERRGNRLRELGLWREFDAEMSALSAMNRAHSRSAIYAAGMRTEPNRKLPVTSMPGFQPRRERSPGNGQFVAPALDGGLAAALRSLFPEMLREGWSARIR
jgi:hypothetical protein